MTTILPQTYTHSAPLTTLAPHLLPHLPKSLPLLRRLQFHTSSPSARTIATFPPSSTTTTTTPPTSFAATWADRTRSPETECWLFSTFETLPPLPQPTPPQHQEAKAQCLALLAAIARLPSPTPLTVIGSLNESLLLLIGGEDVGRMIPQDVVSRDIKRNNDEGTGTGTGAGRKGVNVNVNVISGISVPYRKWLIAPPTPRPADGSGEGRLRNEGNGYGNGKASPLPPGYAFSALRRDELALTISRTAIPKTEDTLAQLGCVGVRYTSYITATAPAPATAADAEHAEQEQEQERGELIAWAFLGVDGSLTSLHVEPAHRGRGLAKAVSRRLFRCLADDAAAMGFGAIVGAGGARDGGGGEYGEGEGWAHSDVAEDNLESAGVARGLGGLEGWRVRWVSVDLAAVVGRETRLLGEEVVG